MTDIVRNCPVCNIEFVLNASQKKLERKGRKVFCSQKCSVLFQKKELTTFHCSYCNCSFKKENRPRENNARRNLEKNGYICCSKKCATLYQKGKPRKPRVPSIQKKCPICQTLLKSKASAAQTYCSMKCSAQSKKIEITPKKCFVCEKEFLPTKRQIGKERTGEKICCAISCSRKVMSKLIQLQATESDVLYWEIPEG